MLLSRTRAEERRLSDGRAVQEVADGDPVEELLSVAEAALRYGLSEGKVRKMISLHELEGVRKVRGEYGLVWRIPAAAFEARGLMRQTPAPKGPDATVTVDHAELRRTINGLTGTLRMERQRVANKQQELEDALLQIGQLRRELKYERTSRRGCRGAGRSPACCCVDLVAAEQGPRTPTSGLST